MYFSYFTSSWWKNIFNIFVYFFKQNFPLIFYTKKPKEIFSFTFFKQICFLIFNTENPKEIFFFYFFKQIFFLIFNTKNPKEIFSFTFFMQNFTLMFYTKNLRNFLHFFVCTRPQTVPLAQKVFCYFWGPHGGGLGPPGPTLWKVVVCKNIPSARKSSAYLAFPVTLPYTSGGVKFLPSNTFAIVTLHSRRAWPHSSNDHTHHIDTNSLPFLHELPGG